MDRSLVTSLDRYARQVTRRQSSLNLAVWIAAVPVALAAVRLLMFSRGDPILLRVLVDTAQVVPILIASTLQVLPWALSSLGAIMLFNASSRASVLKWITGNRWAIMLAALVVIVIVNVSPIPWLIAIVVVFAAVAALAVVSRVERSWAIRINEFARKADNNDPAALSLQF